VRACSPSYEEWVPWPASGRVIDCDSVGSFSILQPNRQFVYGLLLCFLAALLATEAKAAWAADWAGVPSDISAVKLCSPPMKQIEVSIAPLPDLPAGPPRFARAWIGVQSPFLAALSMAREINWRASGRISSLPFSSFSLFLRPPPELD
jgi:hypothetical protein